MRCAKVVGAGLALGVLTWALWAQAHQGAWEKRERGAPGSSHLSAPEEQDTIWYSGFEPGDPLGVNVDYSSGSSPDEWHVTDKMLYERTSTWMTADRDTYFCHIGDDSTGYSHGNHVGYQIDLDLSNYSEAYLYYRGTMEAWYHPTIDSLFDRFAVWGVYPGIDWIDLDPAYDDGQPTVWYGDWGGIWYSPDPTIHGDTLISLVDLVGHADVIIEFWFYSNSGNPQGLGVGIDEILITGTPTTSVEGREEGSTLPQHFALEPPYPNPFNSRATIRYRVPETQVHIDIYNVCGQLVRTLAEGPIQAGSYVQTWDGRDGEGEDVKSGLYFCRLRAENICLTQKLVLLR